MKRRAPRPADPVWSKLMQDPALRSLWEDMNARTIDQVWMKQQAAGNRKTRVMPEGASLNYRYVRANRTQKGSEVRFCWAVQRNAAGFFLGWQERVTKTAIRRTRFIAYRRRKTVAEMCQKRRDAWNRKHQHTADGAQ